MTFDIWFDRHGSGLDRAAAFQMRYAAVDAAYKTAVERSEQQRQRVGGDIPEIDQEHAAARFMESRMVASIILALKARV